MKAALSRRRLPELAGTALMAGVVTAEASGLDARLLARVETFVAELTKERAMLASLSDKDRAWAHAYLRKLAREGELTPLDRQALAIAKLPARTPEGLRAKARAAAWNAGGNDTTLPRILIADDLLGSLLADLTGLSHTAKGARA